MRLIRRGATADRLDAVARAYAGVAPSSATSAPRQRRHFAHVVRVGRGPRSFDRLVVALLHWDVHREAGLAVGSTGPVSLGSTVVPVKWFGPVGILLPCRVVDVVDGPRRQGFTYATLRDHPEEGEERFTVALADDGTVTFEVEALSRPAGLLPRLGRPVADALQDRATMAYLRAASRVCSQAAHTS